MLREQVEIELERLLDRHDALLGRDLIRESTQQRGLARVLAPADEDVHTGENRGAEERRHVPRQHRLLSTDQLVERGADEVVTPNPYLGLLRAPTDGRQPA